MIQMARLNSGIMKEKGKADSNLESPMSGTLILCIPQILSWQGPEAERPGSSMRREMQYQSLAGEVVWEPWSFKNGLVVNSGTDGMIRYWNIAGKKLDSIKAADSYISGLAWSSRGYLASCGGDQTVKVWEVEKRPGDGMPHFRSDGRGVGGES